MYQDDFDDEDWVSKTDLKKEAAHAQVIGEQLLLVTSEFLQSLELDEDLVDAIELAKRIKHHSGKRRQIQRVGKLMRRVDLEPIEAALAQLHQAKTANRDNHHKAERARDDIIERGVSAVDQWLPDANNKAQLLAELKNLQNSKAGTPNYKKHSRLIFRLIRDAFES